MRGMCSSLLALLACCIATAGCSLSPPRHFDAHTPSDVSMLQDARFASANVRTGVWTPSRFQRATGEGIYFIDHYDESKIPVLFVHGLYGSPRNFQYLIEHLDRTQYQPWLYYYASGANLTDISERLAHELDTLCTYYDARSIIIVAHSMGGLIARDVLLRAPRTHRPAVPVLITLSTPWDGHLAASVGARMWPGAVPAWHDLATRSGYIEALFVTNSGLHRHLPDDTEHHLFASIGHRDTNASDGVVSVASQLREEAIDDSYRIYRFKESHVGILHSPGVVRSINHALATLAARPH